MTLSMNFTIQDAMSKVVREAVAKAINDTDTWVHHPSFNDKTTIANTINNAFAVSWAIQRVRWLAGEVDTESFYPDDCGVDWARLQDVLNAVRDTPARGDKTAIKNALHAFRVASPGKKAS